MQRTTPSPLTPMKPNPIHLLHAPVIALILATAAPVLADRGSSAGMRDVATHDQLSQRLRMQQQKDPIANLGPAKGRVDVDPSVANEDRNFVKNSAVLSYRGSLTLVPKRSLLHVPDALASRLTIDERAKVMTFQDFLLANRAWIRTVEVTREQALGHVELPASVVESFSKSNTIVVATFKQGPISVLPLKDSEEVPSAAEMKSKRYAQ